MAKVKVITRHAVANYGSLLQTYATQHVIEKLGHEVEIINYVPKEEQSWRQAFVRYHIRNVSGRNPLYKLVFLLSQMINYGFSYRMFKHFRKRFSIKEGSLYSTPVELKSNPPEADIYVTGSDQVWGNIGTMPYDPSFFLHFAPADKRCIAYSASFGTTQPDIDAKSLVQMMNKYSAINVREMSAKKILNDKGFNNVNHVLDPTFLLSREEWQKIAAQPRNKAPYILVYQLHSGDAFEAYAETISKKLGLPIVRLSCSMNSVLQKGKFVYMCSPNTLLRYFMDAQLVLTDSFHATAFSLILNKNFVTLSPGKTSTRIKSILESFDLGDRLLDDLTRFDWLDQTIDFDHVNKSLAKLRDESIGYLSRSLHGVAEPALETVAEEQELYSVTHG